MFYAVILSPSGKVVAVRRTELNKIIGIDWRIYLVNAKDKVEAANMAKTEAEREKND